MKTPIIKRITNLFETRQYKASLDPNWSLVETGGFRMFKSVGVLKKGPNININAVKMLLDR